MKNKTFSRKIMMIWLLCAMCVLAFCACDRGVTIRFDSRGGTKVSAIDLKNGSVMSDLPAVERSGYVFAGWFCDPELTVSANDKTADGDMTLYAGWGHTVTFVTDGDTYIESVVVLDGRFVDLTAIPTHPSLTFAGWYLDADHTTAFNADSAITSDITLYALFLEIVENISTPSDFLAVGNNRFGEYTLLSDIDMGGMELTGFFSSNDNSFRGTFNGNDHAIFNFKLRSSNGLLGVFGINEGAIRDLNLSSVSTVADLSSGINNGGILCAVNNGSVINCSVSATAAVSFGGNVATFGAVTGNNYQNAIVSECDAELTLDLLSTATVGYYSALAGLSHGSVTNCDARISGTERINAGTSYFGTVAAYTDGILDKCAAYGENSSAVSSATVYIGGLTGASTGGANGVKNSCSTVDLTLSVANRSTVYIGGLSATLSGTTSDCFASGNISGATASTGNSSLYAGGFCASLIKNAVVKNCVVMGDIKFDDPDATVSGAVALNGGNCSKLYRFANQNVYGVSTKTGVTATKAQLSDVGYYSSVISTGDDYPISLSLVAAEKLPDATTKDNPIVINTKEDYLAIPSHTVNFYRLGADIDFGGAELKQINFNSDSSGIDGADHTLSSFVLCSEKGKVGLIGANGGTVKNLIVEGFSYSDSLSESLTVGVIAAVNSGTVTDCTVSGGTLDITAKTSLIIGGAVGENKGFVNATGTSGTFNGKASDSDGNCRVGGVVGINLNEIAQCAFLGTLSSNEYGGGIAATSSGKIYQSLNRGAIVATSNDKKVAYAGGLVGYTDTASDMTNNYNTGFVSATSAASGANAGGLIGYAKGTLSYCYSTGTVSALAISAKQANAGGLVGVDKGATITYGYFGGTVSAVADSAEVKAVAGAICAVSAGTITSIYFSAQATVSAPEVYETPKQVKINVAFNYEYAAQNLKFSKEKWYNGTSQTSLPRLRWEFPSA